MIEKRVIARESYVVPYVQVQTLELEANVCVKTSPASSEENQTYVVGNTNGWF